MIQLNDKVTPTDNVRITVRNEANQVIDVREGHNIFVDQGREWLAALSSGNAVFGHSHPQIVAYMGVGKGGALQDVPAERTSQTENSGVTALATLVPITSTPTNLAAISGTIITPATTVQFSRIFQKTEITYPTITGVPLSEIGLFMVETSFIPTFPAHPDIDIVTPPNTPRLIAYHQFRTITKTDQVSLQFDWELRF